MEPPKKLLDEVRNVLRLKHDIHREVNDYYADAVFATPRAGLYNVRIIPQ